MLLLPGAWMFAVHLVMFVYFSVQHALWGRTLGKRMAGTRVVRAVDLGPITWRQAAVREALNNFLRVIPLAGPVLNAIDVLWVFGDRNRQALHDKAAHTIVVWNKSALPPPPYRPASVDA